VDTVGVKVLLEVVEGVELNVALDIEGVRVMVLEVDRLRVGVVVEQRVAERVWEVVTVEDIDVVGDVDREGHEVEDWECVTLDETLGLGQLDMLGLGEDERVAEGERVEEVHRVAVIVEERQKVVDLLIVLVFLLGVGVGVRVVERHTVGLRDSEGELVEEGERVFEVLVETVEETLGLGQLDTLRLGEDVRVLEGERVEVGQMDTVGVEETERVVEVVTVGVILLGDELGVRVVERHTVGLRDCVNERDTDGEKDTVSEGLEEVLVEGEEEKD